VNRRAPRTTAPLRVLAGLDGLAVWVGLAGLAGCVAGPSAVPATAPRVTPAAAAEAGVPPRRPQLDDAAAAALTPERVLALAGRAGAVTTDGWNPRAEEVAAEWRTAPHYVVDARAAAGPGRFATVQAAVNHAHHEALAGRAPAPRIVIGITPGDYPELVYLPAGEVPITLRGLGGSPDSVRIHQAIDGRLPVADYVARHAAVYEAAGMHPDIAAFYRGCARPAGAPAAASIGTTCTAVVWTRRAGTRIERLSMENSYDQGRDGVVRQSEGLHQAVALKADGSDRLHLREVRLLGHQDTLYLAAPPGRIVRSFVHRSLVAGDVDFIFGAGTAYFLDSEIRYVGGLRHAASGYIAAPSTALGVPHGFVFDRCDFTQQGGGRLVEAAGVYLARQWFTGARCSPYGPNAAACRLQRPGEPEAPNSEAWLNRHTLETVGKMVVLHSTLGPHLRRDAPWAPWQFDRNARNHRPAQFDSDHFHRLLQAAGHDPVALGFTRPARTEPFLAEYRNQGVGALAPR